MVVGVAVVERKAVVVEGPAVVSDICDGVDDNCALVVAVVAPRAVADDVVVGVVGVVIAAIVAAVVAPIAAADVDVVVLVAAAVVDAFVVAVVGALAFVQVETGRLEQKHPGRAVVQSCGFQVESSLRHNKHLLTKHVESTLLQKV
jgi:hypothetical protein